jgi:hypothetical protein
VPALVNESNNWCEPMNSNSRTTERTRNRRRGFLGKLTGAIVLIPFAAQLVTRVALAAEKLSEDDPTAVSLGYKNDAALATHETYVAGRNCAGCAFFQGDAAPEGPCLVFRGKLVNAKGWCASWRQRG